MRNNNDLSAVSDTKAAAAQLHMATRYQRLQNHCHTIEVEGKKMIVSALSFSGCYNCHKSMFRILDGVGGEKCSRESRFKPLIEPS